MPHQTRDLSYFLHRVIIDEKSGCWNWKLSKCGCGYGRMKIGGKLDGAHRVMWATMNGEIPSGMCVCHRCDNPACVNPTHLFLGTRDENTADMVAKGRACPGEENWNHKLTESDVIEILRVGRGSGMTLKEIGTSYGVRYQTISKILQGVAWRHIPRGRSR